MAEPTKNKVLLFNPRSANHHHRLPLSLLQVAASVAATHEVALVDGNLERDPWLRITQLLDQGDFRYFGCTVMPGPQLKQAIPFTRNIRSKYPEIVTIWGGYFPSLHYETAIRSGYIDYIIRGCGDRAFPALLQHLGMQGGMPVNQVPNLVFRDSQGKTVTNFFEPVPLTGFMGSYPLDLLHQFYPVERYLPKTWIGSRTIPLHTSFGCPHQCSFCGVAAIYGGSWHGQTAEEILQNIRSLEASHGINGVEFLDSNFFASKSRVLKLCRYLEDGRIRWWAEGRVDTLGTFSEDELKTLKRAGCDLVFMGAESGSDAVLRDWNKGGTQTAALTEELVRRFAKADIIPELSFVLGLPVGSVDEVWESIQSDISFVRKLKKINPQTEFILYVYSPVPQGSQETGPFRYPASLDEWLDPAWEPLDLRRDPRTPWLKPHMTRYVGDFTTVLNAAYPSNSELRIRGMKKYLITIPGKIRYALRWYRYPLELKALLKWIQYRRPELEGFRAE